MTIKQNLISKDTLPQVIVCLVCKRSVDGAIWALNNSDLNEAQKQKIKAILQEPLPGYTIKFDLKDSERYEAAETLRQRISAVISKEGCALNDTSATAPGISSTTVTDFNEMVSSSQITPFSPSEQEEVFSFTDTSTSPFAMDYPCAFEFEGKHYQNATTCFLAQQYTDQPDMMNLFTTLGSEEASALAELTPMTKERKLSWENPDAYEINKNGVLMQVQRAKFSQNPELKNELLSTGSTYLVHQGNGFYLTDNFNGTGENALGYILMSLRREYGGTNVVAPPASYLKTLTSQQERNYRILYAIPGDVVSLLFKAYIDQSDWKTLTVFPLLNKYWNQFATTIGEGLDLNQICPELTIIDAKAQGVNCDDEPKISKFKLIKGVKEMSPHIEENAGVTMLTMVKDTSLNQLIKIARAAGITVDIPWKRILKELGDVPVKQTYVILITNNVFMESRAESFKSQKTLVNEHGCEMPTVQEYVALCVFMNKLFKTCLYGDQTFGRSSTHVGSYPKYALIVGDSASSHFHVYHNNVVRDVFGAGGRRKF